MDDSWPRRSFRLSLRGTCSKPGTPAERLHPQSPALSPTHMPPHPSPPSRPTPSLSPTIPVPSPTTRPPNPSAAKYVHYTLDPGPSKIPGTAAYYESWAFRCKKLNGDVQVPGGSRDAGPDDDKADDNDDDPSPKTRGTHTKDSSVLVFSHTGVRKAKSRRKVDERKKRASRRMKALRRMEGRTPLLERS